MTRSISKKEFDELRQRVNVLIVTAMQVEADAVNVVLDAEPFVEEIIPLYQQYRFGYFGKYLAAHLMCGQAGMNAATEITAALAELRGTGGSQSFYVLMPGIACGLKRSASDKTTIACEELEKYFSPSNQSELPLHIAELLRATLKTKNKTIVLPKYMTPETDDSASTQQIGDILVASSLWQHNFRATKVDRTENRGGRFAANRDRLNLLLEHAKEWQQTAPEADYGSRRCRVHSGLVISGDELLNHFNRREELRAEYKDAIGLDMEGHGLGTSVLSYSNKEREGQAWFLFAKGICDWGVGKGDGWQKKAAAASVSLLRFCLENPNFFPELIQPVKREAVTQVFTPSELPCNEEANAISDSGTSMVRKPPLDDALQACQQQVERSLPSDWRAELYVSRSDLAATFEEFRKSDRPLFVLIGNSGCGKSWECYAEAAERLNNSVRLLIRGTQLEQCRSLVDLIRESLSGVTRPDATAEELFQQLKGIASDTLHETFVLIADEVLLSSDPAAFEDKLEVLCQEAQHRGIKLALSVRSGVWQRLSQGKRLAPYLFRHVITPEQTDNTDKPDNTDKTNKLDKSRLYSYELTRLSDSEMQAMLVCRLPASSDVDKIALALRHSAFAALRNPYLLKIYIRQYLSGGNVKTPVAVDVDVLLDEEAQYRFNEVARRSACEPDEIDDLSKLLAAEMWHARRVGKPSGELVQSIDGVLAGFGRKVLPALQSEDILTRTADIKAPVGAVVYANPQFGDRLTALWLAGRMSQNEDVLAEMEPGLDDGIMTALVRQAIETVEPDAVKWAGHVLECDSRWLSALAQGLAQRQGDDWRIPAMLTAWSNRDETYSTWNAMRALGAMAGHSSYARAWIGTLYADEKETQALKGQFALSAALEIAPSWVKRRMLLRLRRDLQRPSGFMMSSENREQARYLSGALQPLQAVSHAEAAATAHWILAWFQSRYVSPRKPERMDVRETLGYEIDAIRGRVALFGNGADIPVLVQELGDENLWTRQAAARALLPVAEGRPEHIKEVVFHQAGTEQAVVGDVSRLLYFYTESDPESVIEAIQKGNMLHTRACGIALTLLAHIACIRPALVGNMLPGRLDTAFGSARTLLNELLAFTWWQYASQVPHDAHARSVLEELSGPLYEDIQNKNRAFAAYSASVAVLARIALDIGGMSAAAAEAPMIFHHLALETNHNFLYVQTLETCGRFASQIATHSLFTDWYRLLCQTAREDAEYNIHPADGSPSEWQFRVTNLATDWLCACAPYVDNPAAIVAALPPDWPLLRFCTALVHTRRITPEIIEQAGDVCAKHINVEGNISRDRDLFLYALREAALLPPAYAELLANRSLGTEARLSSLEADIRRAPETILETLHAHVNKENAVPILWEWACDATDWRAVLLSHTLRAMFSPVALSLRDCRCVCDQALTAIRGLPASRLKHEYQGVYTTLSAFCDTDKVEVPTLEFESDLLSQSHRVAIDIVRAFQHTPSFTAADCEKWICSGIGWVHDRHHWLENGSIVNGHGVAAETWYFPPALSIASLRSNQAEYVSGWMREQAAVQKLLSSGSCKNVMNGWHQHIQEPGKEELLTSALKEIDAQIACMPRNVRLNATRGEILLQLNHLERAQEVLQTCLTMPWYDAQVIAGAHYDLACCYARKGEAEQCRSELHLALPSLPHMGKKHVENDSDFTAVRGEQWFINLTEKLPDLLYFG